MNLRDNADGTCNCRMIAKNTCFFADGFDGRCDCKCHFANPSPESSYDKITKSADETAEIYAKQKDEAFRSIISPSPESNWEIEYDTMWSVIEKQGFEILFKKDIQYNKQLIKDFIHQHKAEWEKEAVKQLEEKIGNPSA